MKRLYEGNTLKNFITFSIPLIFSAILAQTHNLVDSVMVSRFAGESSLAAIGSTSPLLTFISSMVWGYGAGSAVYAAHLFGKGDNKGAVNASKVAAIISTVFCLVIGVIFILAHDFIFKLLNIPQKIHAEAFSYFAIYSMSLAFLQINSAGVYYANAFGVSYIAPAASVISCALNIAGNYLMIAVFKMGVTGAAIATAFSAFVVVVYYILRFKTLFAKLGFSLRGIQFSKDGILENLKYSFPNMLQQSVMYLSSTFVSPLVNKVGTSALAGYTAAMKIYDVNAAIYQNSNKTITNYVAHCCGAKKYSLLSKGISTGIAMTMCYLSVVLIPTVFAPEFTAGLFFGKGTNIQSMEYAVFFLKYCMPFVVFNVVNNAFHGIFRGSGSGRYLVVSTLVYAVSRTLYSYVLFPHYGIHAIFVSVALSWVTEAVFGSIIYFSEIWKSEEHKQHIKK